MNLPYFLEDPVHLLLWGGGSWPKIGVCCLFIHKHCCLSLCDDLPTVLLYRSEASVMCLRVIVSGQLEAMHIKNAWAHISTTLVDRMWSYTAEVKENISCCRTHGRRNKATHSGGNWWRTSRWSKNTYCFCIYLTYIIYCFNKLN